MNTFETYTKAIRATYEKKKGSENLSPNLYKLTPGNIRNELLSYDLESMPKQDISTIEKFLSKKEGGLRTRIKNQDLELLKPICTFLKKGSNSLQSIDTLELIAVLIDFMPRPYSKYRNHDIDKLPEPKDTDDQVSKDINQLKNQTKGNTSSTNIIRKISILFKEKKIPGTALPETMVVMAITSILILIPAYILVDNIIDNDCMIWVNGHYEKTKCSGKKLEKKFVKEVVKNFKELKLLCKDDTFFLNEEPVVWYDKSKTIMTYFTAPGIHPINRKTLKPITQTIIDNHIEPCP